MSSYLHRMSFPGNTFNWIFLSVKWVHHPTYIGWHDFLDLPGNTLQWIFLYWHVILPSHTFSHILQMLNFLQRLCHGTFYILSQLVNGQLPFLPMLNSLQRLCQGTTHNLSYLVNSILYWLIHRAVCYVDREIYSGLLKLMGVLQCGHDW